MLVAATVTSGCHTADVASDSGSGGNTSLTNGALDIRHGYAALSLAPSGLTFCILLFCSRPRLMLSEQYYSTSEHSFGVWLHNLCGDLCYSALFRWVARLTRVSERKKEKFMLFSDRNGSYYGGSPELGQGYHYCTRTRLDTQVLAGGHINPAVSFAFFFAQKISLIRAICYIIVQVSPTASVQCQILAPAQRSCRL